ASQEIRQITPADQDGWVSFEYTFSKDFTQISAAAASNDHMPEVVKIDAETGAVTRLTHYDDLTKNWRLGSKEVFRWASQDGTQIEGVLSKPADFDPARKYPLLVVIHGGPTWMSLMGKLVGPETGFYPIEQWLHKGALVLQPNYRGSGGYGEEFQRLNVRNLGVGDYWDVISGVDALIERGWVDSERVGAMGWSQGGYISAFITTYSNRFKAVSVGAGISNWVTYYVNTDIHPFTRDYLGADPWTDMEIYRKTSPMTYIQTACTPTLIQHGDQDNRVPVPNAFELYQGLVDRGVEARLQIYPGMRHSSNKPRTQRHIMQTNLEWFNKWIWGEELPDEKVTTAYTSLVEGICRKEVPLLPALERYQGTHLQQVYQHAKRDQAAFFVFSGEFGLVDADFPVPPDERPLMVEDLTTMAQSVAERLCDEGIKRVVLHTAPAKQNAWVLMYLGCLQAAAGMTGSFSVEHVENKEE
ncbi:MAG: prolyl oligopeptidase family serine peptidase, partial [Anaerolineaceae bacterium]